LSLPLLGAVGLGAIGRAGAFAFTGVLAPLLLIAAPVTLAGVQPLASVLFDVFLDGIVRDVSRNRGRRRTGATLRGGCVQSGIVPPSKPVKAATSTKEFFEIFIYTFLLPRFVGLQT
jgi:hypothetical protein